MNVMSDMKTVVLGRTIGRYQNILSQSPDEAEVLNAYMNTAAKEFDDGLRDFRVALFDLPSGADLSEYYPKEFDVTTAARSLFTSHRIQGTQNTLNTTS